MGEYYNTIILRHAEGSYTKKQFKNYSEEIVFMDPILIQKN